MKKLFLLSIGAALSIGAFAQSTSLRHAHAGPTNATVATRDNGSNYRITAVGGTDTLTNWTGTDTLALYIVGANADSGYCAGTDVYGDQGFGERYDFTSADSSLKVIGVVALFGGSVNPASTNHVTFDVWSVAAQSAAPFSPVTGAASAFWFDNGLPNTVLTSQNVPFTNLGISSVYGGQDTAKIFMFTTPTAYLTQSFFVGFNITYTFGGGDTIGLYSNKNGERTSALYTLSGADTIVNDVNASEYNDGTWHDNAADNFGLAYNYFMFPIVSVGTPVSVKGITRNNLTFFGNYPNPANDMTNIKFSLVNSTNVTVTIMDMAGHTINTINKTNLAAGENIITVNTSSLPSGDYLYIVHTASGDGIASKMTIAK